MGQGGYRSEEGDGQMTNVPVDFMLRHGVYVLELADRSGSMDIGYRSRYTQLGG